ncbi:hypothetical protein GCM10023340_32840 [Nocardioides marinquilinus]|uniref:Uncharacterized protein n=1 Tax=Nocardioides marinquilinus TaxID=1210400 RepID=A0ABP9PZN4_9ACTN
MRKLVSTIVLGTALFVAPGIASGQADEGNAPQRDDSAGIVVHTPCIDCW